MPPKLTSPRIRRGVPPLPWCVLAMLAAAPGWAVSQQADAVVVSGVVTDGEGALLEGAHLKLVCGTTVAEDVADSSGQFRLFSALPASAESGCKLEVAAEGFKVQSLGLPLVMDADSGVPMIHMVPTEIMSSIEVVADEHAVAQAQVKLEEKQRVLGAIPNFYVVYFPNAPPLSARQKLDLAWKSSIDPIAFLGAGFNAGIEQWRNDFPGYGEGAAGYGKRFGASFADGTIGTYLGGAILPIIFRQDPRYFYQGTGSIRSRTVHALASVIICRSDSGRPQTNYSNLIGTFASAGISNAYYPASDRGASLVFRNAASGIGFGAFASIMQEFVVRKLTPHLPIRKGVPAKPPAPQTVPAPAPAAPNN